MNLQSHVLNANWVRRFLRISRSRIELLFTAIVIAFVGTLLWMTFDYSGHARTLPLIIGVPTFLFLLIALLGQVSIRVGTLLEQYQLSKLLDIGDEIDEHDDGQTSSRPLEVSRFELIVITGWILGVTTLFFVIGIKEAIAVFLLGYYRFQAKQTIIRTLLYTAIILTFIYGVFAIMLGMTL